MADTVYVHNDEHGVMRIGQTRVMLDSVIAAFDQGHTAETIVQLYPALTLEEVYGTITYYLAHRTIVDQYLQRQEKICNRDANRLTSLQVLL